MTTPALHLLVSGNPRAVIEAALSARRPVVLTENMLCDLVAELRSDEAAIAWLAETAAAHRVPVGLRAGDQTVFIAPTGWSSDRLQGWVGTMHEVLAAESGAIETVTAGSPQNAEAHSGNIPTDPAPWAPLLPLDAAHGAPGHASGHQNG